MHEPGPASLTLLNNRVIVLGPTSLVVNLASPRLIQHRPPLTAHLNHAHPGQSQEKPVVAQSPQPTQTPPIPDALFASHTMTTGTANLAKYP